MGRTSDLSNSTVWLVALPDGVKKSVLVQSREKQQKLQAKYCLEKGKAQRERFRCRFHYLPVEAPIAPIRTAGIAINKHPNEAAKDRPLALAAVLHDNTR